MLWFLALAAERGFVVEHSVDDAVGNLTRTAPQRQAITEVVLHPRVRFAPDHAPTVAQLDALHEAAHHRCFIANSVKAMIRIEATS